MSDLQLFLDECNTTCTVSRKGTTPSSAGVAAEAFSTVLASIPCRIQAVSATEAVQYQHIDGRVTHNIFLPLSHSSTNVTVRTGDRIVSDGTTYDAVGPGVDESGEGVFQKVIAEQSFLRNSGDF